MISNYILLITSILLNILAQGGLRSASNAAAGYSDGKIDTATAVTEILFSPGLWFAFACAATAGVCWVLAITKIPLSQAYPLMAITFPAVIAVDCLYGGYIPASRVLGASLIVAGIVVTYIK